MFSVSLASEGIGWALPASATLRWLTDRTGNPPPVWLGRLPATTLPGRAAAPPPAPSLGLPKGDHTGAPVAATLRPQWRLRSAWRCHGTAMQVASDLNCARVWPRFAGATNPTRSDRTPRATRRRRHAAWPAGALPGFVARTAVARADWHSRGRSGCGEAPVNTDSNLNAVRRLHLMYQLSNAV